MREWTEKQNITEETKTNSRAH